MDPGFLLPSAVPAVPDTDRPRDSARCQEARLTVFGPQLPLSSDSSLCFGLCCPLLILLAAEAFAEHIASVSARLQASKEVALSSVVRDRAELELQVCVESPSRSALQSGTPVGDTPSC